MRHIFLAYVVLFVASFDSFSRPQREAIGELRQNRFVQGVYKDQGTWYYDNGEGSEKVTKGFLKSITNEDDKKILENGLKISLEQIINHQGIGDRDDITEDSLAPFRIVGGINSLNEDDRENPCNSGDYDCDEEKIHLTQKDNNTNLNNERNNVLGLPRESGCSIQVSKKQSEQVKESGNCIVLVDANPLLPNLLSVSNTPECQKDFLDQKDVLKSILSSARGREKRICVHTQTHKKDEVQCENQSPNNWARFIVALRRDYRKRLIDDQDIKDFDKETNFNFIYNYEKDELRDLIEKTLRDQNRDESIRLTGPFESEPHKHLTCLPIHSNLAIGHITH